MSQPGEDGGAGSGAPAAGAHAGAPEVGLGTRAQRDAPESARTALRPVIQFLANVTVLTALLVYFGWRRSATQAERLGLTESVLDMSTRDYLLRSVRPVLVLLVGVSVAGLGWVVLDRWLVPRVRADAASPRDGQPGSTRWLLQLLGIAWLLLPALVWVIGFVWAALAFVLFPVSIGVGVLLALYAAHLRQLDAAGDDLTRRRAVTLHLSAALLAGVCLFWTAANYAQVEGVQLAQRIAADITLLPGATVYSQSRLYLDGPGVVEGVLAQDEGQLRYRYTGLRLLEHTGDKYFLVSDGWTRRYGVLFVVRDDEETLRLDIVRDRR